MDWIVLCGLVIVFVFMCRIIPFLRKSWEIVRVRKIQITLHYSWIQFILFLAITVFITSLIKGEALAVASWGAAELVGGFILVYFIVILHELGHSFTAQYYGYNVKGIILIPFGGLAGIEGNWYEDYKHEFWIAMNGPMVNVVFALLVFPFIHIGNAFISFFFIVNVTILALNMLPVYPMDGGRLFRCFWTSIYKDWWTATKIAHRFGMVSGIIASVGAFYYGYYVAGIILPLMGFLGGRAEYCALRDRKKKDDEEKDDKEKEKEFFEAITLKNPDMPLEEREVMAHRFLEVEKFCKYSVDSFAIVLKEKFPNDSLEELTEKIGEENKKFLESLLEDVENNRISWRWDHYFQISENSRQKFMDRWIRSYVYGDEGNVQPPRTIERTEFDWVRDINRFENVSNNWEDIVAMAKEGEEQNGH
jgi:Zn-dependent protease